MHFILFEGPLLDEAHCNVFDRPHGGKSRREAIYEYEYPEPLHDIPTWLRSWNYNAFDPGSYGALHWPEGRPRENLDVLVAGCGTMQAAVLAFNNPECKVTGIDFSETSIAHEERLRERHRLENLTLRRMDLCDAVELDRSFDLIVSSGVLHHLPDPNEGLTALAKVLEPIHGVMCLMVYGRMARIGVYALQDVFRRMRVPQTAAGIKIVRETIQRLPPRHAARWYFDTSPEMQSDAAIVDTFLHPQDTAYSVADVLDFVEKNGLVFKGWLDSAAYYNSSIELDEAVDDRDRWSIAENLTARMGQHRFLASLPQRDPKSQITFEGSGWYKYFPQRNPDLRLSETNPSVCFRGGHEFTISEVEAMLLELADGQRAIAQILKHKQFASISHEKRAALAKDFYQRMWRYGHVFYSAVPVKVRRTAI